MAYRASARLEGRPELPMKRSPMRLLELLSLCIISITVLRCGNEPTAHRQVDPRAKFYGTWCTYFEDSGRTSCFTFTDSNCITCSDSFCSDSMPEISLYNYWYCPIPVDSWYVRNDTLTLNSHLYYPSEDRLANDTFHYIYFFLDSAILLCGADSAHISQCGCILYRKSDGPPIR